MSDASATAWTYPEVELLRRDIVYFYDVQSEYSAIEPDIDWSMLTMKYWRYLSVPVPSDDEYFLERGCLTIIIAGALASGGNICSAFGPDPIEACGAAVSRSQFTDSVTERIRLVAKLALELATEDNARRDFDRLAAMPEASWVHASTVRAYCAARSLRLARGRQDA